MTPEQFIYWLQGYLEVSQSKTIDATGTDQIRKHLALVLTNVTDVKEVAKPIGLPDDGRTREIGERFPSIAWPKKIHTEPRPILRCCATKLC